MDAHMLALSTTDDVLRALRTAHEVSLLAYTLRPGRVEDALVAAAKRGARVTVRLEGQFYHDEDGTLGAANAAAIDRLSRAGADARLVNTGNTVEPKLHAKAIVADNALYLDDRNWPDDGADTIVRDDFSHDRKIVADAVHGTGERGEVFTMRKRDSLASEAKLLAGAHSGEDIIVESESFGGGNRVYRALEELGDSGASPRVLVATRDLEGNAHERAAIEALEKHGVRVRVIDADEKFALAGTRGWLGSTNATPAFDRPDQLDWGARTDDPTIVERLRERFEERWKAATEITAA